MKKLLILTFVLAILTACFAADGIAEPNDEAVTWFQGVTSWSGFAPTTKSIYVDDKLVLAIPRDWNRVEYEDSLCAFEGTDEMGNRAVAILRVMDGDGMTIDELAQQIEGAKVSCRIQITGITFFAALDGEEIISVWLSDEDEIFIIRADLESSNGMTSEKLIADLHAILCDLRIPYKGELEEVQARARLSEQDHSDEEPVNFRDAELERMLREALGKAAGEAVYAPELETITRLSMRFGIAAFNEEVINTSVGYRQDKPLDLSDLALLPNLKYLSVTEMDCTGFEALRTLPKLRNLTLICAGVTDCGVLEGLSLESINLARNDIQEFAPLGSMTSLKSLNLFRTGLDSLEGLRNLTDLEQLIVSGNPISDLEPLRGMKNLYLLYIGDTGVESLNALRGLKKLREINISGLNGISMEPLYDHYNLQTILAWDTKLSDADRERFADAL